MGPAKQWAARADQTGRWSTTRAGRGAGRGPLMSVSDQARGTGAAEVLAGGGEMGALVRAMDWAATLLGPVEGWPRSLITAVTLVLESRYPMMVLWGPDLIQVYNDAFRPILGTTKHPAALGQRATACWSEIWDVIGPLFARAGDRRGGL